MSDRGGILVDEDKQGGQQEQRAEGVAVGLALAAEVVADQVAGAVEQVDERAWQLGLQTDDIGDKRLGGVAQIDAPHLAALAAMGAVGTLVGGSAIEAVLQAFGLLGMPLGEQPCAYDVMQCHVWSWGR